MPKQSPWHCSPPCMPTIETLGWWMGLMSGCRSRTTLGLSDVGEALEFEWLTHCSEDLKTIIKSVTDLTFIRQVLTNYNNLDQTLGCSCTLLTALKAQQPLKYKARLPIALKELGLNHFLEVFSCSLDLPSQRKSQFNFSIFDFKVTTSSSVGSSKNWDQVSLCFSF